jgi:hypothetical protein
MKADGPLLAELTIACGPTMANLIMTKNPGAALAPGFVFRLNWSAQNSRSRRRVPIQLPSLRPGEPARTKAVGAFWTASFECK